MTKVSHSLSCKAQVIQNFITMKIPFLPLSKHVRFHLLEEIIINSWLYFSKFLFMQACLYVYMIYIQMIRYRFFFHVNTYRQI